LTAELSAFVLRYGDKDSALYQNVIKIVSMLVEKMMNDNSFGDMGIGGFIVLVDTIKILELGIYDHDSLQNRLNKLVKNSIEYDISKWKAYKAIEKLRFLKNFSNIEKYILYDL